MREYKIWAFLLWLKEHNYLYKDIILSEENLNAYPDSDAISGIEHRVIHEKDIDVAKVLAEETAGIDDHPALQVLQSNNENEITVQIWRESIEKDRFRWRRQRIPRVWLVIHVDFSLQAFDCSFIFSYFPKNPISSCNHASCSVAEVRFRPPFVRT